MRLISRNMITGALVDTTAILKTDKMTDLELLVQYTRVSGAGAGDMSVYGAMDSEGAVKYLIGFAPILTGTADTDGAVSYTTSLTGLYEIPGVHPYIYIDWNETTDPAKFTVDLIGVEDDD